MRTINLSQEFLFAAEESKPELAAITEPSFISRFHAVKLAAAISLSNLIDPVLVVTHVAIITMKNYSIKKLLGTIGILGLKAESFFLILLIIRNFWLLKYQILCVNSCANFRN